MSSVRSEGQKTHRATNDFAAQVYQRASYDSRLDNEFSQLEDMSVYECLYSTERQSIHFKLEALLMTEGYWIVCWRRCGEDLVI